MAIELGHEGLAETHDFCIALAVGIKVGTALTTAHGQRGKAVLEGLLEAQELHNRKIYVGSKTQSALVGTNCAVELYTIAAVYVYLAGIVCPYYAELNYALGLYKPFQKASLLIFGMLVDNSFKRIKYFFYGLKEFRFVRIAFLGLF